MNEGCTRIDTKKLRRLAQEATPGPWYATGKLTRYVEARIDGGLIQEVAACGPTKADGGYGPQQEANARLIAAANPATISELLDRLEEAEKERNELSALVVMRFDHDYPPQFTQGHDSHELTEPVTAEHCRWFVAEIERLRAKIEQQKPVGIVHRYGRALNGSAWLGVAWNPEADELPTGTAIYALPGAQTQGEEK